VLQRQIAPLRRLNQAAADAAGSKGGARVSDRNWRKAEAERFGARLL